MSSECVTVIIIVFEVITIQKRYINSKTLIHPA